MAYTYRNKKTGDVITLNRKATTAFWEEVDPEEAAFEDEDTIEEEDASEGEDTLLDVIPESEDDSEEPVEEAPQKTGRRGKK